MIKIVLSSAWAQGGQTEFNGSAGRLRDVIKEFVDGNPDYRRRLLDTDGEPLTYFNVYVDDDLVPRHRRATATVNAGSTITIIPPLAGG
jgi:sulfur-carrier protein